MIRIIDGNDTGKTKKLLKECGEKGLFVCAHPDRIEDKCRAYGISPVEAISYEDFLGMIQVRDIYNLDGDAPIYIDELEKFVNYCVPYLAGYSLTNE